MLAACLTNILPWALIRLNRCDNVLNNSPNDAFAWFWLIYNFNTSIQYRRQNNEFSSRLQNIKCSVKCFVNFWRRNKDNENSSAVNINTRCWKMNKYHKNQKRINLFHVHKFITYSPPRVSIHYRWHTIGGHSLF